jgi:hypothetical protein
MGHYLLAVLVGEDATVDTIDAHLHKPMRRLVRAHRVDDYRLGGGVTGAWDPDYQPETDPANWRPCPHCAGTTRAAAAPCTVCADAEQAGRTPGTVLAFTFDWAPHPGDLVPLSRLMRPDWRFPPGRTPHAWVDLAGVVWLGTETAPLSGTDTGQVPDRLRQVFDDLLTGRRNPEPGVRVAQRRFDETTALVAVVDAHH